jgi:hypothetical protein
MGCQSRRFGGVSAHLPEDCVQCEPVSHSIAFILTFVFADWHSHDDSVTAADADTDAESKQHNGYSVPKLFTGSDWIAICYLLSNVDPKQHADYKPYADAISNP